MYKRDVHSWIKHFDFIVLDLICLLMAFVISYIIRHGLNTMIYESTLYRSMALFIVMSDVAVYFFMEPFKNVLRRGYYRELVVSIEQGVIITFLAVMYLFMIGQGGEYSREVLYCTGIIYILLTYIARLCYKGILKKRMKTREFRKLLIVTDDKLAEDIINNIKKNNFEGFYIVGTVLLNADKVGQSIGDVKVVANKDSVLDYVRNEWIEEIFVSLSPEYEFPQKLVDIFIEMGFVVHINLMKAAKTAGKKKMIEKVGNYTVITNSVNCATTLQMICKRILDIVGGIVGCFFTGLLFLVIAPVIKKKSPGPVIFTQTRVGKNGKRFKMYKFRTMYPDAEERKKELEQLNRVNDGKMFKIEFDPRIIGNEILPDGTHKTGFMDKCRRMSLDEFPQFFNVLKGDMSLVGTRPPTLDEVELYDSHHYVRLATKPGITGLWQVSGRSNITDFEEVVRLDLDYISDWSLRQDIKIILKTILMIIKRDGAM